MTTLHMGKELNTNYSTINNINKDLFLHQMKHKQHPENRLNNCIAMPFVYFQVIPLVILDVSTEIFHRICFPLYGLSLVDRKKYIKIDRQKLKYLTIRQKIGCVFCGYANGVLPYTAKIAAETENYWCGIQHKKDKNFKPPEHHKNFLKYNDEKAFKKIVK